MCSETSFRSPRRRLAEFGPIASVRTSPLCVARTDGRLNSTLNWSSFNLTNSNVCLKEKNPRLISTYARRKNSRTPEMSKTASGLPPLASTLLFSSSKRILPSPSRSAKLNKIVALIPPSAPALANPSDMAAPTAISACNVTSGRSTPVTGSTSLMKKPFSRLTGLCDAMNCCRPSVS